HNAHGEVEYRGFVGSLSALRRGSLLTVILLFTLLSLLLLVILAIADYALQTNAFPGAFAIVVGLAVLFIFFQLLISPAIVRWAIRDRRPITAESNPWVYQTVVELARQAGVPTPKIWESGDASPNAFVFGRTISSAELVITQGLLERLNQDEIRAVLAHEIGHLRHRDVIIMTLMSAVPLIAYVIARLGFEALRGNVRVRGKGSGQAYLIIIASAIVSYAVYLVAQLLVLYLSRTREYYADAYSGAATRDPHLLASALTKIAYEIARLGFEALRGNVRVRGKGSGQAYLIIIASAIVSYAVYLVAQLLVLYLSRTREYYADAYSGAATRDPHLLASALTKIAY